MAGSPEAALVAAVEALAAAGADRGQGGRLPPIRAQARATAFDETYTAWVGSLQRLPDESLFVALQALDRALNTLVGEHDPALWTDDAVRKDPRWEEVRSLARDVLAGFSGPGDATLH